MKETTKFNSKGNKYNCVEQYNKKSLFRMYKN